MGLVTLGWHKYGHPGMSQEVQGKVGTWDFGGPYVSKGTSWDIPRSPERWDIWDLSWQSSIIYGPRH